MCTTGLQWGRVNQYMDRAKSGGFMAKAPVERKAFLGKIPLFQDLDDELLGFLADEVHVRLFPAGKVIVYQGESGGTCHVITDGRVRVYVVGEDGRELAFHIMGPGEIFGEMSLFEDLPRSASVEALEETHTLELDQEVMFRCLQRSPALALRLLQSMSARLRTTTKDAEGLASLPVTERLMRQLQRLAERSGRPVSDGVQIMIPLTQQDLAALVGTSRESVNRALVRLRHEGKVRLRGGWIILLHAA